MSPDLPAGVPPTAYPTVTDDPGATRWNHVWPCGRGMGAPLGSEKAVGDSATGLDQLPLIRLLLAKIQT